MCTTAGGKAVLMHKVKHTLIFLSNAVLIPPATPRSGTRIKVGSPIEFLGYFYLFRRTSCFSLCLRIEIAAVELIIKEKATSLVAVPSLAYDLMETRIVGKSFCFGL